MNAEVTVYNIQCLSGSSSVLLDCQFVCLSDSKGALVGLALMFLKAWANKLSLSRSVRETLN